MFCGIKSNNKYIRLDRDLQSFLPLDYCPVDDALFEVSKDSTVSGM